MSRMVTKMGGVRVKWKIDGGKLPYNVHKAGLQVLSFNQW